MKIVNKIILSAVAAAALVFATACSNDYTVEEYDNGAKKVYNQAEIIEAILNAQGGGSSEPINATIDFGNADLKSTLITKLGLSDPATSTKLSSNIEHTISGVKFTFLESSTSGFKYNQASGITIKGDIMKISGIKGNYDVEVIWAIAGAKAANDRTLTIGAGEAQGNADTSTADSAVSVDNTYALNDVSGEILFSASNEVVIKTVRISQAD